MVPRYEVKNLKMAIAKEAAPMLEKNKYSFGILRILANCYCMFDLTTANA
jgi:hypothetical protein